MRVHRELLSLNGYFLSFIGLGLTAACLGPTLPGLAIVTGSSLAQVGFLVVARSLGGMIGSFCAGPALDRGHGRVTLTLSLLAMAVCMALVPVFQSLLPLIAVFFLLGAGQGALNSSANTLLVWEHPNRAHALLSALHFCFGVGAMLAPLMVAWFLPIRADGLFVYWVFAIALLPLIVSLAVSQKKAVKQQAAPVASAGAQSSTALVWAVALFFLYVGAEATAGSWLFSYAEQAAQFTSSMAAYLVATFWGTFTLGRLLTVVGSSFISPTRFVLGSMGAATVASLGILFLPQDGIWLWISVAALGLSMAAVFPQAFAFVMSALGMTGRRTGWLLIASSLGGMLMPWLSGHMLESVSAQSLPILIAASTSLAVIAFLMVKRSAQDASMATGK